MNLTKKEKISYGLGAVGKDMVYALVAGFLMFYYNDVLGISATFVGFLFMGARIFDAINDPFMGIIVEKTNTRWGKFRPWLGIGTVLNAIILYAMFAVPESLTGSGLLVYTSIAYILWGLTYTIMDIPYWSMIPAITSPGKERENISVIARSCAGLGYAIPTALTVLAVSLLGNGNERQGYRFFALLVSAVYLITITITILNVKEKTTIKTHAPSIKDMLTSLVKNDQAIVVVVGIIIFNASLYLTQSLALYFFKYDIGNAELFGVFGIIGGATQILAMMSLPILRKKFEAKKILVGAICLTILGYTLLFVLGTVGINNIVPLCLAAMVIFSGFGLATVLTTIFLANTVDYGDWKYNQRNESVIFSLQTFVVKLASAVSALIAGLSIDFINLDSTKVTQTSETLLGLRIAMIGIPMLGLTLSIFYFLKKYKLDDTFMEKITKELKERGDAND